MNKNALIAFGFWIVYNTIFTYATLFWVKATQDAYAWALLPIFVMSCFMVAITMGSQTRGE